MYQVPSNQQKIHQSFRSFAVSWIANSAWWGFLLGTLTGVVEPIIVTVMAVINSNSSKEIDNFIILVGYGCRVGMLAGVVSGIVFGIFTLPVVWYSKVRTVKRLAWQIFSTTLILPIILTVLLFWNEHKIDVKLLFWILILWSPILIALGYGSYRMSKWHLENNLSTI